MTEDRVTVLLRRADVDDTAREELLELIYSELRALAARQMQGERSDHTLQPTALANEALVRLWASPSNWQSRAHFFGAAATAMRRVLVDHARKRNAKKRSPDANAPQRNGGLERDEGMAVLELHDLLSRFEAVDERRAKVAELRIFTGLTNEQIGEVLGVARSTVAADWTVARAWLAAQINGEKT